MSVSVVVIVGDEAGEDVGRRELRGKGVGEEWRVESGEARVEGA